MIWINIPFTILNNSDNKGDNNCDDDRNGDYNHNNNYHSNNYDDRVMRSRKVIYVLISSFDK